MANTDNAQLTNHRVIKLKDFQSAIDWIKARVLDENGKIVRNASFDSPLDFWYFYEPDGQIVYRCDHNLVERIQAALDAKLFLDMTRDVRVLGDDSIDSIEEIRPYIRQDDPIDSDPAEEYFGDDDDIGENKDD